MNKTIYPPDIPVELIKIYSTDYYISNKDKLYPVEYYIERDFFQHTELWAVKGGVELSKCRYDSSVDNLTNIKALRNMIYSDHRLLIGKIDYDKLSEIEIVNKTLWEPELKLLEQKRKNLLEIIDKMLNLLDKSKKEVIGSLNRFKIYLTDDELTTNLIKMAEGLLNPQLILDILSDTETALEELQSTQKLFQSMSKTIIDIQKDTSQIGSMPKKTVEALKEDFKANRQSIKKNKGSNKNIMLKKECIILKLWVELGLPNKTFKSIEPKLQWFATLDEVKDASGSNTENGCFETLKKFPEKNKMKLKEIVNFDANKQFYENLRADDIPKIYAALSKKND